MKLDIKNRGAVSLAVTLVGSLIGIGLLTAAVLNNGGLSSVNKANLLAQVSSTAGTTYYKCPDYSSRDTGSGSWTKCNGQISTQSTCDSYSVWWWNPPLNPSDCTVIAPTTPIYQCPDNSSSVAGSGSWTKCNGQITTESTCDSYNKWWWVPAEKTDSCALIAPSAPPLTVTVPNGGETWQLGSIHTIQWTPYDPQNGVNVVPTVSAYLEKLVGGSFTTVGKIIESGKASIHWTGDLDDYGKYPEPGSYYVRVVNSQTGQSDRSDSYFKVVAQGTVKANLSINKSEGPISLPAAGDTVAFSWTSSNADSCKLYLNGLADDLTGLPASGERSIFLKQNTDQYEMYLNLVCSSAIGDAYDYVIISPYSETSSYVKITSPNGGENLPIDNSNTINWAYSPDIIGKFSVALYKNDAFFKWIASDLYGKGILSWNPSSYVSNSEIGGQVFKIYIIGYKSAGGTVEDKSDAPFTITAPTATAPALTISVSTEPPAQSVVGGVNQFEFARYILDASTSGYDIEISPYFPVKYTVVSGNATDLTNCKLYDGSTMLTTGGNVVNPVFLLSPSHLTFNFDSGKLVVSKGTTKQLSLRCDVKAGASGSYQFGYESGVNTPLMVGVGSDGQKAVVNGISNPGSLMKVVSAGTLNVSLSYLNPYLIVSPGETVELLKLKFSATGEDVQLKQLALQLSSPELNTPIDLVNQEVTLWDGLGQQVGVAVFANGDTAISSAITNFTIPKDGFKALSVRGVIAGISPSGPLVKSGDLLKVDYNGNVAGLNGTYGGGVSSGQTITPSGGDTNSTGVRIMKAYPEFTSLALLNHTLQVQDGLPLYRFKVVAKNGDISIAKFSFSVSSSTASKFSLYAFTDSAFSSPDADYSGPNNAGGLLNAGNCYSGLSSSSATAPPGGNLGTGSALVEIYPDKIGCNQSKNSLRIPSGTSRWFELRASVGSAALSAGSVSTQLEGDAADSLKEGMDTAGNVDLNFNDDFIWSPNSLGASQLSDVDWTNGYGVPGLPSTNMLAETLSTAGAPPPSCAPSTSCVSQYCQYGGDLQNCGVTNADCSTSSYTTGSCKSASAPVCDSIAQAVLDSAGGCSQINSSQYPSVYKACCSLPSTTTVTKETLLGLLNNALQDGVISDQEKADLLKALNDYLF